MDDYWIETAQEDERDGGPYRLCTLSGHRFGLSVNDAKRAQANGLPYRQPGELDRRNKVAAS